MTKQSTNYSFIIPHHNSPDLLLRCINSIPQREDIEVIVVDDNSDNDKKPYNLRTDVKLITIDAVHSKGAGRARNYGLEAATGKWLLFADCDDFYESRVITYLDKYKNSNLDMVCFNVYYAYDLELKQERWTNRYSMAIDKFMSCSERNKDYWLRTVKHIIQGPWNFMVQRNIVKKHNIYFEEVPKGNDARFHHIVSMNCHKVAIIQEKLYYWIWTENSITHKKASKAQLLSELSHNTTIKYRIDADAWNTIPSFFQGMRGIKNEFGYTFCLKYGFYKLICGIPWHKIWWHKLIHYK